MVATPAGLEPAALPGATVLVIDVLRASTSIIAALSSGCAGVVPVAGPEEARRRAGEYPPGAVLIAGERRGEPIAGFDLGNSPVEFASERVRGKIVVFTTSNGTAALLAARPAAAIGVAAFVNLAAAVAWALAEGRAVVLLCAGERGARSIEDVVCAGLLVDRLLAVEPAAAPTDRASEAAAVARAYGKDVARLREDSPWARHLAEVGRAADVAACFALDTTTLVPRYLPDVDKVIGGPR